MQGPEIGEISPEGTEINQDLMSLRSTGSGLDGIFVTPTLMNACHSTVGITIIIVTQFLWCYILLTLIVIIIDKYKVLPEPLRFVGRS